LEGLLEVVGLELMAEGYHGWYTFEEPEGESSEF